MLVLQEQRFSKTISAAIEFNFFKTKTCCPLVVDIKTVAMCIVIFEARVIPVYNGSSDLLSQVLEETGGLGVDILVDAGGKKNHSLYCNHVNNSELNFKSGVSNQLWFGATHTA